MWAVFGAVAKVYNYLATNLSTTRAAKIDNADVAVSGRQASWGAVAGTKTNIDTTNTNVNTVNTKLGTNADAGGTTTVFARLKQTYDYMIGTLLTAVNGRQASWGAVAGTKTNIDNTNALIGTANPASGGTNTIFNFLKRLSDYSFAGVPYASARVIRSSTVPISVLSVTGAGYLSGLTVGKISGTSTLEMTITIDGVAISLPVMAFVGTTTHLWSGVPLMWRFNTSLSIDIWTSVSSQGDGWARAYYSLD